MEAAPTGVFFSNLGLPDKRKIKLWPVFILGILPRSESFVQRLSISDLGLLISDLGPPWLPARLRPRFQPRLRLVDPTESRAYRAASCS